MIFKENTEEKNIIKVENSYLEGWGQVVLEEPELDRSVSVFPNWQHHDPGELKKKKTTDGIKGRKSGEKKTNTKNPFILNSHQK